VILYLCRVSPSRVCVCDNRESLDVNADNRLPATHRLLFLINSLLLAAAPVYLFSQIFDMPIPENVPVFGGVSVVSAVMLTMACQWRAKGLIARLINKRGIELQVFTTTAPRTVTRAHTLHATFKCRIVNTGARLVLNEIHTWMRIILT
jgi:hypothetical protein